MPLAEARAGIEEWSQKRAPKPFRIVGGANFFGVTAHISNNIDKSNRFYRGAGHNGTVLEASDDGSARWPRGRNGPESICDTCLSSMDHDERYIYSVEYDLPAVERQEQLTNYPST